MLAFKPRGTAQRRWDYALACGIPQERVVKHLLSLGLIVSATAAYIAASGPLFFGAPLLGALLLLAGMALEVGFWRRLRRVRVARAPRRA